MVKKTGYNAIEPDALGFGGGPSDAVQLSIAISLRRIADAIAPTEGLRFGEQMGQDIAGNIEAALSNALYQWIQNK